MKVLANDGIDPAGKKLLEEAGYTVITDTIEQADLPSEINNFEAIIVRSATKIRKELIDVCTNLKVIGRAGVGMDNIDVEYARSKGIAVVNTPAASSLSVAELVFAHLLSGARFINRTNRIMPEQGNAEFKNLKKASSKGVELNGKTIGIVGFGRIGQACAHIALGMGMKVIYYDPYLPNTSLFFQLNADYKVDPIEIPMSAQDSLEDLLHIADFVSLHVPFTGSALIGEAEIQMMKPGAALVNCARGGVVDESSLKAALVEGRISFAGIDVFEQEPPVYQDILKLDNVSLSPHIGASTQEAQKRVGIEMAERIIAELR
jgi:D-3-phosphoglycerate dehydrogenase